MAMGREVVGEGRRIGEDLKNTIQPGGLAELVSQTGTHRADRLPLSINPRFRKQRLGGQFKTVGIDRFQALSGFVTGATQDLGGAVDRCKLGLESLELVVDVARFAKADRPIEQSIERVVLLQISLKSHCGIGLLWTHASLGSRKRRKWKSDMYIQW